MDLVHLGGRERHHGGLAVRDGRSEGQSRGDRQRQECRDVRADDGGDPRLSRLALAPFAHGMNPSVACIDRPGARRSAMSPGDNDLPRIRLSAKPSGSAQPNA